MKHNYFISYKYSDATILRDVINNKLKTLGHYNHGETNESEDLTGKSEEYIKSVLKDPFFNTTITIVVISPNMLESDYIPWEIEYSIKYATRENCSSHPNGIVAVIMEKNNSCSWFMKSGIECIVNNDKYNLDYVPYIIRANRYNLLMSGLSRIEASKKSLPVSYIDIIRQSDFLNNCNKYIDSAYDKSLHESHYDLVKSEAKAREKILSKNSELNFW